MENFKLEKKGYSKLEVDAYLNLVKSEREALNSKSIRLEELKAENAKLKAEINVLKTRENSVNDALMTAIEKAKEMDYSTKIRFALEGERIKLFRQKWINFCDKERQNLKLQDKKGLITNQLLEIENEIINVMGKDLNLVPTKGVEPDVDKQYLEESKRILNKAKKMTASESRIEENLPKEFDLNDLDNPPNLEDLCKQLGLI